MSERWMTAITALLLLLLQSTESTGGHHRKLCEHLDKEKVKLQTAKQNQAARIFCPVVADDETPVMVSLHRRNVQLHATNFTNGSRESSRGRFQMSWRNFTYSICQAEVEDEGLYMCKIQTKTSTKTMQTALVISDVPEADDLLPCPEDSTLQFSVSCGILLFNLILTVTCCYIIYRMKRVKPLDDIYMNTRRRRHRPCHADARHTGRFTNSFI